jgi:hypothetical protein
MIADDPFPCQFHLRSSMAAADRQGAALPFNLVERTKRQLFISGGFLPAPPVKYRTTVVWRHRLNPLIVGSK